MIGDIEISEKKLEDIIYDHLVSSAIHGQLDAVVGDYGIISVKRQFNLGPYGIADIIAFNEPDHEGIVLCDIYELKKGIINKDALIQILRYKAGFEKYLSEHKLDDRIKVGRLLLVGASISRDDFFELMPNAIEELEIYTYDIDLYGIKMKSQNEWGFPTFNFKNIDISVLCADYQAHDQECGWYHHNKKRGINVRIKEAI